MTATPPSYNYNFREIGTVPQNTELHIDKVCLTNDKVAFLEKQKSASMQLGFSMSDSQALQNGALQMSGQIDLAPVPISDTDEFGFIAPPATNSSVSNRRRLLQFDVVATALSVAAIAISVVALDTANRAIQKVDRLTDTVENLAKSSENIGLALQNTQALDEAQQQQLALLTQQNQDRRNEIVKTQDNVNSAVTFINSFKNATQETFTALNATLKANNAAINATFFAQDARLTAGLIQINNNIGNLNQRLQSEIDSLVSDAMLTVQTLSSFTQSVTRQIQGKDLSRGVVSAYYTALDSMRTTLKPFVLGSGIRPAAGGILIGPQKRVLLDLLYLNWVTPNTGNRYTIYSTKIHFYADAADVVETAQFISSLDALVSQFGSSQCVRPYTDTDIPADPVGSNCKIWAEIRTSACTSVNNSPKFNWQNYTQQATIASSLCENPSVGAVTQTPRVVRTFDQLQQYFAGDPCPAQDGPYTIFSTRGVQKYVIPASPQLCGQSWKQQRYAATQGANSTSLLYRTTQLLQLAYQFAYLDIQNAELQLYGRNPGGLNYVRKPNEYVPTSVGSNGQPIYDSGSQPLDCTYSTWLAVDKNTVPMFSVMPNAAVTGQSSQL